MSYTQLKLIIINTLRYIFYTNKITSILRNKFLQIVLPSFATIYYLYLDIWLEKKDFISKYQEEHWYMFIILTIMTLITHSLKGIANWYEDGYNKDYMKFMQSFSTLTSKAVNKKLNRFKDESIKLTSSSNIFNLITQPEDQINLIIYEIEDLIMTNFGIRKNQLSISIMHKDIETNLWDFKYATNRSHVHTSAEDLLKGESAASVCFERGESLFFSSKCTAANEKLYLLSERDVRTGDGSIFCYPVITKANNIDYYYIITIVTYGKKLCKCSDTQHSEAICEIFSDICTRIDLELTLESIKNWKSTKLKT